MPIDLAVNPGVPDGPTASASSSASPTAIAEAIDGRLWFFPENPNGWSPDPSDKSPTSWYSIDFRQSRPIGSVELYFLSDGERFQAPSVFQLEHRTPKGWQDFQPTAQPSGAYREWRKQDRVSSAFDTGTAYRFDRSTCPCDLPSDRGQSFRLDDELLLPECCPYSPRQNVASALCVGRLSFLHRFIDLKNPV